MKARDDWPRGEEIRERPMVTPEQIRGIAMWTGLPFIILVVLLAPELFLLAVVVVLVIRLIVLHAQRDEVAAAWADETFKTAAAEHRNRQLEADNAAIVARLAEVLDAHADCPAPVEAVTR